MAETVIEFRLYEFFQVLKEFNLKRKAKQDMEDIKGEVESVGALLRLIDDRKLEYEDPRLASWVKKVRDVAYDIEDVVDEFLLSIFEPHDKDRSRCIPRVGSFVKNCETNCHICSALRNIKARFKGIAEQPEKFGVSSIVRESTKTMDQFESKFDILIHESQLVGPTESKETLKKWLLDVDDSNRNKVIAVVGEGGMGKTTLANQIFHDGSIRACFRMTAFVTMSQSLNEEELLKEMIQQLSHDDTPEIHEMNTDQLKETMIGMICNKRYLIVLDDVWEKHHWDCVKFALPYDDCASRVLITTPNQEVATYAATSDVQSNIYHFQRLSRSESWNLFCKKTFSPETCPPELKSICLQMLERCEGLPLAILVLSGLLRKHKVEEWEKVYSILNKIEQGRNVNPPWNTLLSLAFDDLPHRLKPCFLFLSVFPQNHLFEPMTLVRLWVSERFDFVVGKDGNNKTPEEIAEDFLNELRERSLIQIAQFTLDGRIMSYRLHDSIRETILLKSREISFAETIINVDNARNWPERARRLSVYDSQRRVSDIKSILLSRLRSLFLFQTRDSKALSVTSTMSNLQDGHFKLLNVLDLRGAPLEKFPETITKLFLLRYLSLRNTRISSIPASIGNLHHLETLDLKLTCVTELPFQIYKLHKLSHLLISQYKDGESGCRIPPDTPCGIKWKNYRDNLTHVTKFDIFRVQGFKAGPALDCLYSLQKLSIVEAPNAGESDFIKKGLGMLTQLRRLCLVNLQKHHWSDLCSSISKLTNLRSLSLNTSEKFELQELKTPPPHLERLCLVGEIEELPRWMCSLEQLKVLKLVGTRLKKDPSKDCLQMLNSLKVIGLYDALDDGVTLRMSSDFNDRIQWFILGEIPVEVY